MYYCTVQFSNKVIINQNKGSSPPGISELEIQDTRDTNKSASYLCIHLEIYIERRLRTKLYNKTEDFNCELSIYM